MRIYAKQSVGIRTGCRIHLWAK